MLRQAGHVDDPLLPFRFLLLGNPVNPAVKVDVLLDRQVLVKRELLAHISDVGFDPLGVLHDVEAGDRSGA